MRMRDLLVRSAAVRRVAASLGACVVLGAGLPACGGGERQDAKEPSGTFPVEIVRASFPREQTLASASELRIAVRNSGERAIPNLAVSIDSFDRRDEQPGLADPSRPVWVVDRGPAGGDTAYVGTWTGGRLAPGATRELVWRVTPVQPGTYTLKWTVAAGLHGKAEARVRGGRRPQGSFTVRVSGAPAQSAVGPDGEVVPAQ